MKQFFTVLKFELGNYFKNKSFVAATVVLAVILAAVITVPTLFMGNGSGSSQGEDGGGEAAGRKVLAVADESGSIADEESFASYLPEYQVTFCDGEESVRTMVEEEDAAAGFLVTGADSYEYILKNRSMMSDYQEPFEAALARNYRTASLEQLGIDPAEVENVYSVPMQSQTVVLGKDSAQNYWYTYILVFFLYFLIIFYGQMIAVSVTSEKSNRAIEILVTSVDSNSLIFGKVIAGALAGIVQAGVILGSAVIAYRATADAWGHMLDFIFQIPAPVWMIFIVFGILGYLLYAFLFGMVGALVSKTEDISKSSGVVTFLYLASFLITMYGLTSPDSLLVKAASYIPFTSSNAMLLRASMGTVGTWEIALSLAVLAVSCILAGMLAAAVFRFGTLRYGNPIKLSTALRKIREK